MAADLGKRLLADMEVEEVGLDEVGHMSNTQIRKEWK